MKWSDITTDPVYQSLPKAAQEDLKQDYFEKNIAPLAKDAPAGITIDMVREAWMSKPDDSGQGLLSSMLNSAARGASSTVTAPVEGVGWITGSSELTGLGQSMQESVDEVFPVNPIYADKFAVKAAGAVGQAGGMLALGGAAGAAARIGGAVSGGAVASNTMLTQGFLAGSAEGGRTAEAMGLEGGEAMVRTLAGGFTELAAEKLPFGTAIETAAVRNLLGETVESGAFNFIKAVGTEAVEGGASQIGSNVTDIAMAPEGYQAPGVLANVSEAMALEAVGGGVFGLANLATRPQPVQQEVQSQVAAPSQAASSAEAPVPQQVNRMKLRGKDGQVYLRAEDGTWGTPTFPSIKLDPADIAQSAILTDLMQKSRAIDRKLAAPAAPAAPKKEEPVNVQPAAGAELAPDLTLPLEGQDYELDTTEFPDEKITPAVNEPVTEGVEMVPTENIITIPEDLARAQANKEADTERWKIASQSTEPAFGIRNEDGTVSLIDGHHRYVKSQDEGRPLPVKVIEPAETQDIKAAQQGFKNTVIKRDMDAGFITADALTYLTDFADTAIRAGTKAAQWAADMVKQFGDNVKRYIQSAWKSAIKALQKTAAVSSGASGVRMGAAAIPTTANVNRGGFAGGSQFTGQQGSEGAEPSALPTLQKPNGLSSNRRPFLRGFEQLKEGMNLVKSTRESRTVEGQAVPETTYDVRTYESTENAAQQMIDDLVYAQVGKDEVLSLIATGRAAGVPYELRPSEASYFSLHLLNSGRFPELGVTRWELLKAMQDMASEGSKLMTNWKYVLDPIASLKVTADEQTQQEMTKVGVPGFDALKTAMDTEAEKLVSPEARAAINRVRRKLENKDRPSDVMARINQLFYPQEKSLGDQVREDGAKAIADAFFRGKPPKPEGPLNQGNKYVKNELSALLNEALDALGIEKFDASLDKDAEYNRLVQQLGLRDLRSAKLDVIDQLVTERIQEYADSGHYEFANDLADQWTQVSAHMNVSNASNASLRRLVNRQLAENNTTLGKLAKMSATERYDLTNKMMRDSIDRIKAAGSPEAGGIEPGVIDALETDLRRTLKSMLDEMQAKAEQRAAEKEKLANDPEAVAKANNEKAKKILQSLTEELSDTPPGGVQQKQQDELRQIIQEALTVEDGMLRLREYLMEMGVDAGTAASIELAVYESRRRKDYSEYLKLSERKAEQRKKAIETFINNLKGQPNNKNNQEKLSKFMRNLIKASDYNVLDSELFQDAFAHAFELNGLTDSMLRKLTLIWQELNRLDENGRRVLYGTERAVAEEQFKILVNSVSPGARWDNFIFDQYVSGILSSVGSIFNQFSGVFKTITGLDSLARSAQRKNPTGVFKDWFNANRNLIFNMPLVFDGFKGVPMTGNQPPTVGGDFKPTEQNIQYAVPGQKMKLVTPRGSTITLSDGSRMFFRLKSLFTWRAIAGAEALSGTTDWQNRFADILAGAYVKRGMSPAEAYDKALMDIRSNPQDQERAEAQAALEQAEGRIPEGAAVKRMRVEQIKARLIENRLNEDLISRIELMTGFAQFKTPPVGIMGYPIYRLFSNIGNSQNPGARAAKFFLLFGRFLGHTVDTMFAYSPLAFLTYGRSSSESRRNKIIKDIFGDVASYNRQQGGKAVAGTAFLFANGLLMALAQALAGDDEEPVYQIFGNAPMASRDQKEALRATGRWQEGVVRIFGKDFNYLQIPELAGLFSLLGNLSDYARFGQQLYTKDGVVVDPVKASVFGTMDVLASPIKRSTYRQYFELVNDVMTGKESDKIWNVITGPVGGALRFPVVVDLDKVYRFMDGSRDAEGLGQNLMRRIPFVHVGDRILNAYGEQVPDVGVISMFPEPGKATNPDVVKAASINADTGTVRSTPRVTENADGTEPTSEQQEAFVVLAGKYYVESLLRNEQAVRRAFETGGPEAAKKVVSNISSKANDRAKDELRLK